MNFARRHGRSQKELTVPRGKSLQMPCDAGCNQTRRVVISLVITVIIYKVVQHNNCTGTRTTRSSSASMTHRSRSSRGKQGGEVSIGKCQTRSSLVVEQVVTPFAEFSTNSIAMRWQNHDAMCVFHLFFVFCHDFFVVPISIFPFYPHQDGMSRLNFWPPSSYQSVA